MTTYDLYVLDADSGVILGWHKFEVDDDNAAIEMAQALVRQPPAELWRGDLLVKKWEAPSR